MRSTVLQSGPDSMAQDPIRPVDTDARALAKQLIAEARFGALAVVQEGRPSVTRVAIAMGEDGLPLTLVSDLSAHTKALRADPHCSILLGEPGEKGDPLTHPRITLQVRAEFVEKTDVLVSRYLAFQPKAKLYIGFADFHFARLVPSEAFLNGGFGKAYHLNPQDLRA
ncbi:MAG: pyridoxamine 5'-phosphate oxidase family protein [Paracoccaceae bacterium]